jgi:Mor family transcriptional regulator
MNKPVSDNPRAPRAVWPKTLADMHAVIECALKGDKQCADRATGLASLILVVLSNYFGGRSFYLPTGKNLKAAVRDLEIWKKFDGKNVNELSKVFGISTIHVYAILKKQRALRRAEHAVPVLLPTEETRHAIQ